MRKNILTGILLLCFVALFAQNKQPAFYKNKAFTFETKKNIDTALIYYDSTFVAYMNTMQYPSAYATYLTMSKYFEKRNLTDTSLHYLRLVYDSTKTVKRFRLNDNILDAKKNLIRYYYSKKMIDSAFAVLYPTLKIVAEKYKKDTSLNFDFYYVTAQIYHYKGNLKESNKWLLRAMKISRDKKLIPQLYMDYCDNVFLSKSESAMSDIVIMNKYVADYAAIQNIYKCLFEQEKGNLKPASELFSEISKTDTSKFSDITKIKYYYLKSLLFTENGEFEDALDAINIAFRIFKTTYPKGHPSQMFLLEQFVRVYYQKSDFGESQNYVNNLLNIKLNGFNYAHPLLAGAYYESSRVQMAIDNFKQSAIHADSAIKVLKENFDFETLLLSKCYSQKGLIFKQQSNPDSASVYLVKAKTILNKLISNKQHVYFAETYNYTGEVYQSKQVSDTAITNYINSLKIYRILLGKIHPILGTGYYNVGTLYQQNYKYEEALKNLQVSIISNVNDFQDSSIYSNPKLENVMSEYILLKTLSCKVDVLELLYKENNNIELLKTAYRTYILLSDLIEKLRIGYASEESKIFLAEKTSYLYEKAILLCLKLYGITKDESYKKNAFFFSEKSKAGILLSSINAAKAVKIAGIPDSLLISEKMIISDIAKSDNELSKELNKGTKARPKIVANLQQVLFNLKKQYTDLITSMEKKYPQYYRLKYNTYKASVEDVQQKILTSSLKKDKKKYNLLEYFVGKDSVYIFHINRESFYLYVREKSKSFVDNIYKLRQSILSNEKNNFMQYSLSLYQSLFPFKIEKKSHFFIIPDGPLCYIPFEVLLTEKSDTSYDYRKLKYIIRKATLSYNYSATLMAEMKNIPFNYANKLQGFTGFAPVFEKMNRSEILSSNKTEQSSTLVSNEVKSNYGYAPITASKTELETIFKKMNQRGFASKAYFYSASSKTTLIMPATLNSRFLHFATHGILDENPALSGIVMADSGNTTLLTVGEIYGIKINSELVVLSACKTGLGKMIAGEGLISFSRGFFYSGTKYLVVSLWNVPDLATSIMMIEFYKKYGKKKQKDIYKYFQKARLKLINNKKFQAPLNWAPFILIGVN